jgi:hypothetical protein
MGMYGGEQGLGQRDEDMAPMPKTEVVLTSSRRARARENSRSEGAEAPLPNRLSRKVAPSGFEEVVPGICCRMTESAGTEIVRSESGLRASV